MKQWKGGGGGYALCVMWTKQRCPLPILASRESQLRPGWKDSAVMKDKKCHIGSESLGRNQHTHNSVRWTLYVAQEEGEGLPEIKPSRLLSGLARGAGRRRSWKSWLHGG